jgi:hypothetical protein
MYKSETGAALRSPVLQQSVLGSLAEIALEACDELFLPNIRHGQVTIPQESLKSSGAMFIPLLRFNGEARNRLILEPIIFAPTPREYARHDLNPRQQERMLNHHLKYIRPEVEEATNTVPLSDACAITFTPHSITNEENGDAPLWAGRSLVLALDRPRNHRSRAPTLAHELIHVYDAQNGVTDQSRTELRAYHLDHNVDLLTPLGGLLSAVVVHVETIRAEAAIPGDPFNVTPEVETALKSMGVHGPQD